MRKPMLEELFIFFLIATLFSFFFWFLTMGAHLMGYDIVEFADAFSRIFVIDMIIWAIIAIILLVKGRK